MKDLMHGKHYLADLMKKHVAEGCRILTIDCVTQEDLDLIADAVITSKLKVVAVDPGVFTATLARKLITPSRSRKRAVSWQWSGACIQIQRTRWRSCGSPRGRTMYL